MIPDFSSLPDRLLRGEEKLALDGIMKLYGDRTEKVLIDVKGLFGIDSMTYLGLHWWRL